MKRLTQLVSVLVCWVILDSTAEGQGSSGFVIEDQFPVAVYSADAVVVGTLTSISDETRDEEVYRRGILEVSEMLAPADTTAETLVLWWPQRRDVDHKPHLGNRGIWILHRGEEPGTWAGRRGPWLSTDHRDAIQWFVDFGITMTVTNPDTSASELVLRLDIRNLSPTAKEFPGLAIADGFVSADPRFRFTVRAGTLDYPPGSRLKYDENVPPLKLEPGEVATFDLPVGRIWRLAGISRYDLRFECDGVAVVPKIGIRGSGVRSLPVGYVQR